LEELLETLFYNNIACFHFYRNNNLP